MGGQGCGNIRELRFVRLALPAIVGLICRLRFHHDRRSQHSMVPHAQDADLLSQETLEAIQQAEDAEIQARTAAGPQASLSGSSKRKLPPSLCAPALPKRQLGAPESADRIAETPGYGALGRMLPRSLSKRPTEDTSALHYVVRQSC